ncbi:hypothetical protein VEA_003771 [Vibrio antiquarius]|uniref:Uncharacterized protein n=1 Tax=Vibrio antiquarius (strain Ex25) TaxID=150340 RepID=A0ACA6QNU8_VIBAE|nr:hypothetical protein VEA_003771 [Vibrio antiquarius]
MLDHTMRVQMQLDSLSVANFVDVLSRFLQLQKALFTSIDR